MTNMNIDVYSYVGVGRISNILGVSQLAPLEIQSMTFDF